jgi:hypothetical protein
MYVLILALIGYPQLVQGFNDNGLISYLPMNDTSGLLLDVINTPIKLSATSLGYNVVGKRNSSIDFSGGVAFNNSEIFDDMIGSAGTVNGNGSINFWVKLKGEISTGAYVFSGVSDTTTKRSFFALYQYNSGTRRLCVELDRDGIAGDIVCQNVALGTSGWYMITITKSMSNITIYLNGTYWNSTTTTMTDSGSAGTNEGLYIGKREDGYGQANAYIDEHSVWNYALSPANVSELYNSSAGTFYPFNGSVVLVVVPSYNLSNVQFPDDLNSSFAEELQINTTISGNVTSNGSTNLFLKINTALSSNCPIIYGKNCVVQNGVYNKFSMIELNDSLFFRNVYSHEFIPAIYPYNFSIIDSTVHNNHTVYLNNYLKWNIWNFSTNATQYFISLEMNVNNLSTNAMSILYCNENYSSGNPLTDNSCELVDSFLPFNISKHRHNLSSHYVIPITITKTKSRNSSFIFLSSGNVNNGWVFEYVNVSEYDNSSFNIGSYNSWQSTPKLFDVHLHNFYGSDYIQYYTNYSDGNGYFNISSTTTDFFNITNYPPSAPLLLQPNSSSVYTIRTASNTSIIFNWTASQDVNNDSFNYYIVIYNENNSYNIGNFSSGTNSYNWTINANTTSAGWYYTIIQVCDGFGSCDESISEYYFNICMNNWQVRNQPCLGGVKLSDYYDVNGCNIAYDYPSTNGTYENCSYIQQIEIVGDNMINFSPELIIMIIIFVMFLISLNMAINSSGYYKGIFVISGLLLIAVTLIFYNLMLNITFTSSNDATTYIVSIRAVTFIFGTISVALILMGGWQMFSALGQNKRGG